MASEKFLGNMGSCSAEQAPQALYSWGRGSKTAFWTPCAGHVANGSTGVYGKRLKTAILGRQLLERTGASLKTVYNVNNIHLKSIIHGWSLSMLS